MPRVNFKDANGQALQLNVRSGFTLMEAAVQNGVAGILAECGGGCSCATCHVYVAEPWFSLSGEIADYEEGLLEGLDGRRPNSRLSCQIKLTEALDGISLEVPESQGL